MIKWVVRIGCAVGVLIIALVGGLLLAGGGRRIAHSETAVTFNYPAAQIWPWLVEPARLRQWLGGFVDSLPDGGPDSEPQLRIGARRIEVLNLDGRRWEIKSQITALAPPNQIALHMIADEFEDDTSYLLTEHSGITVLTYKNDAHYTMLFARLMSPIICHDVERKVQADLTKLRELLAKEPQTVIAPPQPNGGPAFVGCCAAEPK